MIAFIDSHRAGHEVDPICRILPIAPNTYHAHAATPRRSAQAVHPASLDAALQADIRRFWEANFQVCGVPPAFGTK
jgi:putative transposase